MFMFPQKNLARKGLISVYFPTQVTLLAIQQLPDQYHFNVVMFGTTQSELFPQPQKKTDTRVQAAKDFIMVSCSEWLTLIMVNLI